MSARHLHVAVALAALAASARADASDVAPSGPGEPAVAIVLGTGDQKDADAWKERWEQAQFAFLELFEVRSGYPRIFYADKLSDAEGKNGPLSVVLGICSPSEASARVSFAKQLFPGVHAVEVPGEPLACPMLLPGARLYRSHSVESEGWRLVMNVFLADAPPAEFPGGRKTPHDPNAGDLFITIGLFDPQGVMRRSSQGARFTCISDAVTWWSRCDLRTRVEDQTIVLEMKWERAMPPCRKELYFQKFRSTYSISGKEIRVVRKTLGEKSGTGCGE